MAVCCLLLFFGIATASVSLQTPQSCAQQGKYFDSLALLCNDCGANQVVTSSGLACVCSPGYRLSSSSPAGGQEGVAISCIACAAGTAVSEDGRSCMACSGSLSGGVCSCLSNSIASDSFLNGTRLPSISCTTCSSGFHSDSGVCAPCPAGSTSSTSGCVCPSGMTAAGDGTCVSSTMAIPASAYYVYFSDVGINVNSVLFSFALASAASGCASGANATACQVLANLCVLQYYRRSSYACTAYIQAAAAQPGNVNGYADWPTNLPWLYYTLGTAPATTTDIALTASLKASSGATSLTLQLAAYDTAGHFLGWYDLGTVAQLCAGRPAVLKAYATVGLEYTNACDVDLTAATFASTYGKLVFYDPYLVDGSVRRPVPVRLLDYQDAAGTYVNTDMSASSQLVRRFFLYDAMSGVAAGGSQAVRVASAITLSVLFQGTPGKIYPPVLSVKYTSLAAGATTAAVSFSTTYSADSKRYRDGIAAGAAVCAGLAFLYFVLQMSSWRRRNRGDYIDVRTVVQAIVLLATAFSSLATVVLCAAALYWLIFFRNEGAVDALLPERSGDPFVAVLVTAFFCKLVELLYIISVQASTDIFLVDWEKPPAATSSDAPGTVGLWRTVMVANEWAELQPMRRTSVSLQLLSVLLLLLVAGASDLGSAAPSAAPRDLRTDNYVLRFAALVIVYFGVGIVQWVGGALYARFVEDKLGQFTDLCSVCNVSVFILRDAYHGYYIHGRSVHGVADVDMYQMRENFRKEEASMTGRRGLLPNSDVQTFEIHIPPLLRVQLDDVLYGVLGSGAGRNAVGPSDAALHGYATVNNLLCAFLDHSFRDLDYIVQPRQALASICGLTPDLHGRGLFYPDVSGMFADVMLLGHEGSLFCFDFLLFALIDFLATNYVAGAAVTYAVHLIVTAVAGSLSSRNIARKTMVDARFLM